MAAITYYFHRIFITGCLFLSTSLHCMKSDPAKTEYRQMFPQVLEHVRKIVELKKHRALLQRELTLVYYTIGKHIIEFQAAHKWSVKKVFEKLSNELQQVFPTEQCFSSRQLKHMYKMAEIYPNQALVEDVIMWLPWPRIVNTLASPKREELIAEAKLIKESAQEDNKKTLQNTDLSPLNTKQEQTSSEILEQAAHVIDLKKSIATLNQEITGVYHTIGTCIVTYQADLGWSLNKLVNRLREELKQEFPKEKGLHNKKLKYMYKFAQAYPDQAFVKEVIMPLPWSHIAIILEHVREKESQLSYMKEAIEGNWTCKMLVEQIKSEGTTKTKQTKPYAFS